jgi:hypothetical protein
VILIISAVDEYDMSSVEVIIFGAAPLGATVANAVWFTSGSPETNISEHAARFSNACCQSEMARGIFVFCKVTTFDGLMA